MTTSYKALIDYVRDGEPNTAAVITRPDSQIQANVAYLKSVLDNAEAGQALFAQNVAYASDVLVGQPVYYNNTNNRFEKAQAIAGKSECVGICFSKSTTTAGNLLIAGKTNLDLVNAVSPVVPGRYFLSDATAGALTATRPDDIQISVLIVDEDDNVYVFPHENVSIPGPTGPSGPAAYLLKQKGALNWHIAGQFINEPFTTFVPSLNTLLAVPIDVMKGGTLDKLEFEVTIAGTTGSVIRIGLYDSVDVDTGDLYPNARLLADLGTVDCTTTGIKGFDISLAIDDNTVLWAVINCGTAAPTLKAIPQTAIRPLLGVDKISGVFSAPGYALSIATAFAALPDPFPSSATVVRTGALPLIAYRFSG